MSKKSRSASMGLYSGANLPDLQKRLSHKGFGKPTGTTKTLTFYGLTRGREYTPLSSGGGRIIIVHGIGRLVVDGKVQFETAYVTARFKALRFARELKLGTFYEFSDFLYETWDPKVITPATQDKLHSFMFADFNVTSEKYKELDGSGLYFGDARLIFSSISEIHSFFEGADPSQYGKEKPVLCCRFKAISASGDSMVANGMIRSAWRVSDGHDSITYSAIGDSRTRFSLEVGKEYKAYGFSIYYNGNSPPILQPTMWGHLDECSQDAQFADVLTVDNEDQVEKFFIFTMIKFAAVAMACPAHDCQKLVDAGTLSVLLICPNCDASFRLDSKKLQIKMLLNGVETAPMVGKDGTASAVQGPAIENFRIAEYSIVQKLFGIDRPEKLMSNPKKLHRASAEAMSRLFKVTYHRESLVISDLEELAEKTSTKYAGDSEESSDDGSNSTSPKKHREKHDNRRSAASSVEKKKRRKKTKAKSSSHKKKEKRSRQVSSSSSEADRRKTKRSRRLTSSSSASSREPDGDSSDGSYASSTASLPTRARRRQQDDASKKKKEETKQSNAEQVEEEEASELQLEKERQEREKVEKEKEEQEDRDRMAKKKEEDEKMKEEAEKKEREEKEKAEKSRQALANRENE